MLLIYPKLQVYIGFLSNEKPFFSFLVVSVKPVILYTLSRWVLLKWYDLRSTSNKEEGPCHHLGAFLAEVLIIWYDTNRVLDDQACRLPRAASTLGVTLENSLIWTWSLDFRAATENAFNFSIDVCRYRCIYRYRCLILKSYLNIFPNILGILPDNRTLLIYPFHIFLLFPVFTPHCFCTDTSPASPSLSRL